MDMTKVLPSALKQTKDRSSIIVHLQCTTNHNFLHAIPTLLLHKIFKDILCLYTVRQSAYANNIQYRDKKDSTHFTSLQAA